MGGAHRDSDATIASVKSTIAAMLQDLADKKPSALVKDRREKFLSLGSKGLAG
jgi:acetyl-CoA carboxylase carboxyl transferase subunit alpha